MYTFTVILVEFLFRPGNAYGDPIELRAIPMESFSDLANEKGALVL